MGTNYQFGYNIGVLNQPVAVSETVTEGYVLPQM